MSVDANKQAVTQLVDALNTLDVGIVNSLLADDARWRVIGDLPLSGEHAKEAFFTDVLGPLGGRFAGPLKFDLIGLTAEGERVAAEATSEVKIDNGKVYRNAYHFLF